MQIVAGRRVQSGEGIMTLTDADILARLTAVEDGTVERKTFSDNRDWIKAAVAFSNSLENDQPGVLFVGVYNDGRVQDQGTTNFEDLQKKISGELGNIFPPIYPTILVRDKDGKRFIAVIVYGSEHRPHFAGKSFVRDGTQTKDASETNIKEFIAKRSSKVAEILKWRDKNVIVETIYPADVHFRVGRVASTRTVTVHDCNEHWFTFKDPNLGPALNAISLRRIELSYSYPQKCLVLEMYPG
jgi:Putative DNA-binding domain